MSVPERIRAIAHRAGTRPKLDGRLDSPSWLAAPRSPRFSDMETGRPGLYDTRAAVLWDDEALYVGFWVEEPYPTAHLTERDSIIFTENDVEVFIDGGDAYYEFEVNARNTVYEVFFAWRDTFQKGDRFAGPDFDLATRNVMSFAGDFDRTPASFWRGTHPRGSRWAFLDWDFPGLQSAVHVDGHLNDPTEVSQGWRVEIAFPWSGMAALADGRTIPPRHGDVWRLFFGRFQRIGLGRQEHQAAWCWTPHGVMDTHQPERFTEVFFSDKPV